MFWLIAVLAVVWIIFVLWCCLASTGYADKRTQKLDWYFRSQPFNDESTEHYPSAKPNNNTKEYT
jgi:hypothetical protein